jgi:hypothetical protein
MNSAYKSLDGVLFTKGTDSVVRYPARRAGSYAILGGVTNIGMVAFEGCSGLTNLTIPKSVIRIRDRAFAECNGLTGVYFEGDAPKREADIFLNDNQLTIYYVPGTVGWGPTFGGRPTAIWLPEVQTDDPSFGLVHGTFGFNIKWASDHVVAVEAADATANPIWSPVSTNTMIDGTSYFSDPEWANWPQRFYRLRAL